MRCAEKNLGVPREQQHSRDRQMKKGWKGAANKTRGKLTKTNSDKVVP